MLAQYPPNLRHHIDSETDRPPPNLGHDREKPDGTVKRSNKLNGQAEAEPRPPGLKQRPTAVPYRPPKGKFTQVAEDSKSSEPERKTVSSTLLVPKPSKPGAPKGLNLKEKASQLPNNAASQQQTSSGELPPQSQPGRQGLQTDACAPPGLALIHVQQDGLPKKPKDAGELQDNAIKGINEKSQSDPRSQLEMSRRDVHSQQGPDVIAREGQQATRTMLSREDAHLDDFDHDDWASDQMDLREPNGCGLEAWEEYSSKQIPWGTHPEKDDPKSSRQIPGQQQGSTTHTGTRSAVRDKTKYRSAKVAELDWPRTSPLRSRSGRPAEDAQQPYYRTESSGHRRGEHQRGSSRFPDEQSSLVTLIRTKNLEWETPEETQRPESQPPYAGSQVSRQSSESKRRHSKPNTLEQEASQSAGPQYRTLTRTYEKDFDWSERPENGPIYGERQEEADYGHSEVPLRRESHKVLTVPKTSLKPETQKGEPYDERSDARESTASSSRASARMLTVPRLPVQISSASHPGGSEKASQLVSRNFVAQSEQDADDPGHSRRPHRLAGLLDTRARPIIPEAALDEEQASTRLRQSRSKMQASMEDLSKLQLREDDSSTEEKPDGRTDALRSDTNPQGRSQKSTVASAVYVPPHKAGVRSKTRAEQETARLPEDDSAVVLSSRVMVSLDRYSDSPDRDLGDRCAPAKLRPEVEGQKSKRPSLAIFVPKRQLEEKAAREKAAAEKLEKARLAKEKADREYLEAQVAKRAAEQEQSRNLSKKTGRARNASPTRTFFEDDDDYQPQRIPMEGVHVLEIMSIKASDREQDILEWLMEILDCPIKPNIKWADSTHALAVYSRPQEAQDSLKLQPTSGRLWLQPYSEASSACRDIQAKELQPPTLRPKTTSVVARLLLSSALQNSNVRDVAGEKDLRAQRNAIKLEKKAAKEKRQRELDEAWGSD